MDESKLAEKAMALHPLEIKILLSFGLERAAAQETILNQCGLAEAQFRTALEWLKGKGALQVIEVETEDFVSLTDSGEQYAKNKIPELQILDMIGQGLSDTPLSVQNDPAEPPKTIASLKERSRLSAEEISTAIGNLKRGGVVKIEAGGSLQVQADTNLKKSFNETQQMLVRISQKQRISLKEFSESEKNEIQGGYKKRGTGLFEIETIKRNRLELQQAGVELIKILNETGMDAREETSELTPELLKDGQWQNVKFRKYNIQLKPSRLVVGKFHAYREYLDFLKKRLVALGFEEMQGNLVENEFWNMDALFMPQFHSSREIHDVYFVKNPAAAKSIEEKYLNNVAETHENGGKTGSRGWRYLFDKERSKRLVLRSQGTALSARKLSQSPQIPGKYFAVARCFRYDQVDASHAPDFFQVEGIVLDQNISFRHLLGLLQVFALEIAKTPEMKFVPAYFPFTEPSVEVHMKHEKLGWIELGGAGIFRPEVTIPLGIKVPVIAWGLGIDRMAMVALGINDIRDLFSSDIQFLRDSRIKGIL